MLIAINALVGIRFAREQRARARRQQNGRVRPEDASVPLEEAALRDPVDELSPRALQEQQQQQQQSGYQQQQQQRPVLTEVSRARLCSRLPYMRIICCCVPGVGCCHD